MKLTTWSEGISKAYMGRPSVPHTSWTATVTAIDFSSWYTSRSEVAHTRKGAYLLAKAEWSGQSEWAVGRMGLQCGVSISEEQRLHALLSSLYIPFSKAFQFSVGLGHSIYSPQWRMTTSLASPLISNPIAKSRVDFELAYRIADGWWIGHSTFLSSLAHDFRLHLQSEGKRLSVRFDASWHGQMKAHLIMKTSSFDYTFGIEMGLNPIVQSHVGMNNHVEMD